MSRSRTSLLGCLAALALHSQPHQFEWARQFGAPIGGAGEQARAAATDGTSHVAAGATSGALAGETHAGGLDGFVRKYNTSGVALWTRQIGTAGTDDVNGVVIDSLGNVVVSGTVCGTLPGQSPAGDCDAFVRKYDPAGNISWTRQFGTTGADSAAKVAVDAAGNIAVTGATRGSFPGFTVSGFNDAFVTKLDATGAILWTQQLGTASFDDGGGVTFDATGAIIVAGSTSGAFPGKTNAGSSDVFLARFNSAGALVWLEQFGNTNSERPRDVAIDAAGNIFAVVTVASSGQLRKFTPAGVPAATIGVGDNIYGLAVNGNEVTIAGSTNFAYPGFTNLGDRDAYIRRFNATTMAQIWVQQFGTSQFDEAMALAMTGSTIFVAGHTSGAFPGFTPADQTDLFARQYTTAGAVQWTDQIGSTAPAQSFAVSTYVTATRIITAGQTSGALPTAARVGAEDAFVAVHDLAGNLIWLRQFGSTEFDSAEAVTADATGNIYVVGDTQGTLPGQTKSGSTDTFLRKYDAAGNEIWTRQFGGGAANTIMQFNGIVTDLAGDIFLAGQIGATGGNFDALVRRYNAAGNVVWSSQYGTSEDDYGRGIALDATGGVIIAGSTSGGTFPGQIKVGNADAYVARLNAANGAVTWITQFGPSTGQIASVRSVSIAPDGSLFAVGDNTGAYPGQVAAGGTFDISLAKLSSAGSVSWIRQFGSNQSDRGLAAIADAAGNVTVVGSLGNTTVTDAVLRRYDTNGNVLGTLVNTTPQLDLIFSAAGNAAGIIAAAGYTSSAFPGQTQTGAADALILKFLPPNAPPTVAANNALVAVNEGSTAANSGTFGDANGDVVTLSASIGIVVKGVGTWTWSAPAVEGPSATTVVITANDGRGGITTTSFNLAIANLPPSLGTATGPTAAVAMGAPVTIAAAVSDPGVTDPITCRFSWDDGSTDTVSPAASGACTAAHTFAAAGVYGVAITASDDDGGSATTRFEYVIVFDPTAGFVNGGGFVNTPGGKANFGIVARYQKNATLPTGNTEFHAGALNFDSVAYEWLVLSGPSAQYKGTGKINGVAGYSFIVTVTDAKLPGSGGVNKFRIKIWPTATPGTITYDNVPGAPDDINLANPQTLGGGSINIHDK